MYFFMSADIFQSFFSEKFFQEYHQSNKHFASRSGTTYKMSGLICVQTICKNISADDRSPLAGIELKTVSGKYWFIFNF